LVRQTVEHGFKLLAQGFNRRAIRVTRDPDRVSIEKQPSGERIGDHVAIPTRKEFFFEQAKAKGTIGKPVAFAN